MVKEQVSNDHIDDDTFYEVEDVRYDQSNSDNDSASSECSNANRENNAVGNFDL